MLVLKCMRNTAKQLKRSQPIPSPPHHRGSRCINMGTLGVRTHTWSTNSKWPVTISERGKWKRCEINSIWLPRQVNDNTYHCIHGDLSAGRKAKKKKREKNPYACYWLSDFIDIFHKVPRPLSDAPATRSFLVGALKMWGDVRSPEGWRDDTLCVVEAKLDRDGRAECMCLRVIPGSQQQQLQEQRRRC